MKKVFWCVLMALGLVGMVDAVATADRLETEIWQRAIDDAAANGGGTVRIPIGRHVVGQLYLKNGVELHLEEGAVLEGAVGLHNYVVHELPYSEGTWSAVVMGLCVTNVAITGKGEIFGNGREFERVRTQGVCQEGFRPRGVFFSQCKGVRLEGFKLRDAACWGIVFKCCDGCVVRRVRIDSNANHNNDGFDVEARNVLIEDCDVSSCDDAYCVKSNDPGFAVENVTVRRCVARTHCNAFKIGTATHGTIRSVRFEHCRVELPRRVYRDLAPMPMDFVCGWPEVNGAPHYLCGPGIGAICIECVDGGVVEDVTYEDIEVGGCQVPIFIRGGDRRSRTCGIPPGNRHVLRKIILSHVRGRAESTLPSSITGVAACRPHEMLLRDIAIECVGTGASSEGIRRPGAELDSSYPEATMFRAYRLPVYGLYVDHPEDVRLENVEFTLRSGTRDDRPSYDQRVPSSSAATVDLSGSGWTADGEPVSVPHCWNAVDGADGPDAEREKHKERRTSLELLEGYSRKAVSYRRVLPDPIEDRRQFLKVDAAATVATVKVNGREVGVHKGAFTAFCYEITKFLKPKDNELEIVVDNRRDVDVAPISGDYTMMGGLYRKVWLIETPQVCIDRTIDGGPGVELDVRMDGHVTAKVHVLGGSDETRELYFPNPVLWSPENPKLYEARIELSSGDAVTIPFGFRTTEFREDGFYLNGVKRKLKGVCRHQEVGGKGWATNVEDEKADIALIREMGADAVRTAHYPQSESFYSLLDRAGLVAWCEVPLLNGVTHSEAFVENLKTQYREMVAQLKHHPSICMWSIFNELYENFPMPDESAELLVEEFAVWAKPIDPMRPQVAASDQVLRTRLNRIPADALAFNRYPGWYNGPIEGTRAIFDEMFASNATRKVFGISEYGGGGSIVQHGDPLTPCKENTIHTEEYQAYLHSRYYAEIVKEPRLWGTFLWVMFDFASDYRTEGDHPGINDKGMVCHDHKTKKDVFYFYQANWTKTPTLRLVGRRMKTYSGDKLNLLVFSNVGTVTLRVNDVLIGAKEPDDVATVLFNDVPLTKGANRIVVTSSGLSDSCEIIFES